MFFLIVPLSDWAWGVDARVPNPPELIPAPSTESYIGGELNARSRELLSTLRMGDVGGFAAKALELKEYGFALGVRNFPEISRELLTVAETRRDRGGEEFGFLIRKAVELSPENPRIFLLAAQFHDRIGVAQSMTYIWCAVKLLPRYPSLIMSCISEVGLLFLLAVTMALLLMAAVQLATNGSVLLERVGDRLPRRFAGLLAPVVLVLCLVLPLRMGVIGALLGWSLILTLFVPTCRWVLAVASVTTLCWGLVLPIERNLSSHINSDLSRTIEEINNASYLTGSEKTVAEALRLPFSDKMIIPVAGLLMHRNGEYDNAAKLFARALALPDATAKMKQSLLVNLGATFFGKKEYQKSKEYLVQAEKMGLPSFELYYYLAQVNAALVELSEYNRYWGLAQSSYADRLKDLEDLDEGTISMIHVPLPSDVLYSRLVGTFAPFNSEVDKEKDVLIGAIAKALLRGGSPLLIVQLGFVALILGGYLRLRPIRGNRLQHQLMKNRMRSSSMIWAVVPGGLCVAGARPLSGALFIGLCGTVALIAIDSPFHLSVVAVAVEPFRNYVLMVAATVLVVATIYLIQRASGASQSTLER